MDYSDKGSAGVFDLLRYGSSRAFARVSPRYYPTYGMEPGCGQKVVSHACFIRTFALKLLCEKVVLSMGRFRFTGGR